MIRSGPLTVSLSEDRLLPSAHGHVPENWRACARCGLISALPETTLDRVAICSRCDHPLKRVRKNPFEFAIACGLAGLVFYCLALVSPFLEISALGRVQLAQLDSGPEQLLQQGFGPVGLLVLAATAVFPGVKLFIILTTLLGLRIPILPARQLKFLFRWYGPISPWAMIDVYMLGFLVAYSKLTGLAHVHLDAALYALVGLMICMAAMDGAIDPEAVWRGLETAHQKSDARHHRPNHLAPSNPQPHAPEKLPEKLIGCHCCELVVLAVSGDHCRRCGSVLHMRKPNSLVRSWSLLIGAAVLYIPSNIDPIMIYTQLGSAVPFTIMTGILELFHSGLWPLALLVLLASILIPLSKLLALAYLLIQTQRGSIHHLKRRNIIFNVIDFIGRWSMIDVFMISILVALLRFGQFVNVQAQIGIMCFASVVVLTMFAVESFDTKLMWDALTRAEQPIPTVVRMTSQGKPA